LLGGVTVVTAQAAEVFLSKDNTVQTRPVRMTAIPYYAWCNRGDGKMNVWLARTAEKIKIER
jgi:uncharacterized protein